MKIQNVKGGYDFLPKEQKIRNYINDILRKTFVQYGYEPIETPILCYYDILSDKYDEENDILKEIYKLSDQGDRKLGLRYDLTVPFAKLIALNKNQIKFPFKRYEIAKAFRDGPVKVGRDREFTQCDVDVVGTNSLLSEVELIQIVDEVYRRLGIRVSLHINNRKILAGIAEVIGQPERIIDITVAIDKLDKIGIDNVNKELLEKGIPAEAVEALQPILHLSGTNTEKLDCLEHVLANSEQGLKGIEELRTIFTLYAQSTQDGDLTTYEPTGLQIELDLCLARGLNYYTGAIFEVKALDVQMGSITGGGRYDNLTGIFGMPNVSGVGISFGADRIYDVLTELNLYPENLQSMTELLFATFGEEELLYALRWAKALREQELRVEVYPEPTKMKKQMGYADSKKIPFVAIVGSDEMAEGKVMLKNMLTGEQKLVTLDELIKQMQ